MTVKAGAGKVFSKGLAPSGFLKIKSVFGMTVSVERIGAVNDRVAELVHAGTRTVSEGN